MLLKIFSTAKMINKMINKMVSNIVLLFDIHDLPKVAKVFTIFLGTVLYDLQKFHIYNFSKFIHDHHSINNLNINVTSHR